METTTKKRASHTFGAGFSVDAKTSLPPILDDGISMETKTKIDYTYNSQEESFNSDYESREVLSEGKIDRDDYLVGTISIMDIWSYPIIGYRNPDKDHPPYGFMEIIMPSPTAKYLKVAGKSAADWYQPVHQNGNIFSYPRIDDENFPSDLGSFSLPDGTLVQDTMNDKSIYSIAGLTQDQTISWTEKAGWRVCEYADLIAGIGYEKFSGNSCKGLDFNFNKWQFTCSIRGRYLGKPDSNMDVADAGSSWTFPTYVGVNYSF